MHLNLSEDQLKILCFIYRLLYMNLIVTTKPKSIIRTQKVMTKKSKDNSKENHQTQSEETKRKRNEQRGTTKITRKRLTKCNMFLSIITLGASLVAQWLRVCLLMQGTRVRALVWEDPTCHGAAGPVSHSC